MDEVQIREVEVDLLLDTRDRRVRELGVLRGVFAQVVERSRVQADHQVQDRRLDVVHVRLLGEPPPVAPTRALPELVEGLQDLGTVVGLGSEPRDGVLLGPMDTRSR